jgi:hypothetical protein
VLHSLKSVIKIPTLGTQNTNKQAEMPCAWDMVSFFVSTATCGKGDWERRSKSHPKTLPQHLQIALTAAATIHIGKSMEQIS